MLSSKAPSCYVTESWALPARVETTSRSTATVLGTSIAPQMNVLEGSTDQSTSWGVEKDMTI